VQGRRKLEIPRDLPERGGALDPRRVKRKNSSVVKKGLGRGRTEDERRRDPRVEGEYVFK